MKYLWLFVLIMFSSRIFAQNIGEKTLIAEDLEIIKISPHTYIHISYLQTESWGKVPCNGLIFIHKGEAIIFDTPHNEKISRDLLQWLQTNHAGVQVKAVIVNHFHDDCLGGLDFFHNAGIPSYGHEFTASLAAAQGHVQPQNLFKTKLEIKIGKKKVVAQYFGEAHTKDNIVCWIPSEKVLFGGCMIKAMHSGKGNLADASVASWSQTVQAVKDQFPKVKIVVPGHGNHGGAELLDYTISMFKNL